MFWLLALFSIIVLIAAYGAKAIIERDAKRIKDDHSGILSEPTDYFKYRK